MDNQDNNVEFPNVPVTNQVRAENVFGRFKTGHIKGIIKATGSLPSNTVAPKSFLDQFLIYNNGSGTIRLYWWDSIASAWQYVNATGTNP